VVFRSLTRIGHLDHPTFIKSCQEAIKKYGVLHSRRSDSVYCGDRDGKRSSKRTEGETRAQAEETRAKSPGLLVEVRFF